MRALAIAGLLLLVAGSTGLGGEVEVSASAKLSRGGHGSVWSISCAAPGECAAGGSYRQGWYRGAFVVGETNGSWGKAVTVPGMAKLNSGGYARLSSISCAAAGECAAGGYYLDGHPRVQAFVVSETNGRWGHAIEVPRTAKLNAGAFNDVRFGAEVTSISCAAVGDCAAGGSYIAAGGATRPFVVNETNGRWGNAIKVPGTATLGSGVAWVDSISCARVGECAAGGGYLDGSDGWQVFVVSETNGSWGHAVEVPGTAALNAGGEAAVDQISCGAAGECAAGGYYTDGNVTDRHVDHQAFVVSETNGSWGTAIEVPGTATLNTYGDAEVKSISCAAPGECAAGGYYYTGAPDFHGHAFVVSEKNGSWGTAVEAPGTAALNAGDAVAESMSCAAAGECAAGGYYNDGSGNAQAFALSETNGSWGTAIEVPGTAKLRSRSDALEFSISCAGVGDCAAGGSVTDGTARRRAFVVRETNGSWGRATRVRVPVSCLVPNLVGKAISTATKRLKRAHCRLGKITYLYSRMPPGRVAAQRPKSRTVLRGGARVALTVSTG